MSNLLDFFLSEAVNCKEDGEPVDISAITEVCNTRSQDRTEFKCTDAETSFKNAGSMVVSNFCCNFGKEPFMFPKSGFRAFVDILSSNTAEENEQAKLTCLMHLTKAAALNVYEFSEFVEAISKMTVVSTLTEEMVHWESLAQKVLQHNQLNGVIDSAIGEYGYDSRTITGLGVSIVFVSIENLKAMRGFAGVNRVYINYNHFAVKLRDSPEIESDWLRTLIDIDVITLTLRELGNVKFRKTVNDFYLSSSHFEQIKDISPDRFDLGRFVEQKVFGKSIDWVRSHKHASKEKVAGIVAAVIENKPLADSTQIGAVRRGPPLLIGVDYSLDLDYF